MKNIRKIGVGVSATLALAAAAYASPRETVTFTNQVTEGVLNAAGNSVVTQGFTGSYTATKIRFTGTLTSTTAGTWPDDSRIQVTTSGGGSFQLHPFTAIGGFTTVSTAGEQITAIPVPVVANGTWTFRFYESYDDTGTDANWDTVTFTLDDDFSPPSVLTPVAGVYTEIEDNDSKPRANVINALAPGQSITGSTTGTSTTVQGAASADYFKIKTTAASAGIYLNTLTLSTETAGQPLGSIRGLSQTTGVVNPGTDVGVQTSSTTVAPLNANQWYSFGKQEQLYYAVTGSASTTSPYTATFARTPVVPTDVGTFVEGTITIDRGAANTSDSDFLVYDGTFTALPGYSNDGGNTLTRDYTAGTYYIAWSNYNTANEQVAPADDTFPSENLMDFPNSVVNSSTTLVSPMDMQITDITGSPVVIPASKNNAYEVVWFKMVVAPPSSPIPPHGTGAANPVVAPITGTTLLTVTAVSGLNPPSTGMQVHGDLTQLNGSNSQGFYDDGTHGDVTPGDNVFSFQATLVQPMTPGVKSVPFTVTDAQQRSGTGAISLTASAAPTGGCCVGGSCQVMSAYACSQAGGTYNGNGSNCTGALGTLFTSGDAFPLAINDLATFTSSVTVPAGSGTINGNLVVVVDITHTYVGDVHLTLDNGSTSVILANGDGFGNDLSGEYHFYDAASTTWLSAAGATTTPLPAGDYSPDSPLSAFNGASLEGTWTLTVFDDANIDVGTLNTFKISTFSPVSCGPVCGTADFDGDGDTGTDADIEAFFACLAGNCCATCFIQGADFNGDGDTGTDLDIESFFAVLAGGTCHY